MAKHLGATLRRDCASRTKSCLYKTSRFGSLFAGTILLHGKLIDCAREVMELAKPFLAESNPATLLGRRHAEPPLKENDQLASVRASFSLSLITAARIRPSEWRRACRRSSRRTEARSARREHRPLDGGSSAERGNGSCVGEGPQASRWRIVDRFKTRS